MTVVEASFLRSFLRDPKRIGAVAPASGALACAVARATRDACARHRTADSGLQLIELGAGTGALTKELEALNPVVVEKDPQWAALLRLRFSQLDVRNECALETLIQLARPVGLVTSIPLLNNPDAPELKRAMGEAYSRGLVRFCVLYTYAWRNPMRDAGFSRAHRAGFVPRSIPPAHVWVFE